MGVTALPLQFCRRVGPRAHGPHVHRHLSLHISTHTSCVMSFCNQATLQLLVRAAPFGCIEVTLVPTEVSELYILLSGSGSIKLVSPVTTIRVRRISLHSK